MDLSTVWSVLRWVLVVLVAGFVGQFGRIFATRLIERRQRRRADRPTDRTDDGPVPDPHLEEERLKAEAKLEKKRAKAELKKAKKSRE